MSASSTGFSRPSGPSKSTSDPSSHPAQKLLARAHPTDEAKVTQILTDKIAYKPLFLNSSANDSDKRAARRHIRLRKKAYALKHARPKPLSAKEKRGLRVYELKPEECRYEVYKGLNALWTRYVLEVLGYLDRNGMVVKGRIGSVASANGGVGALIASADFHGMEVEVVRSTLTIVCNEKEDKPRRPKPEANGKEGAEVSTGTGNAKGASGGQDKVRMILKKGAVFRVVLDLPSKDQATAGSDTADAPDSTTTDTLTKRRLIFELHGDQLEIRPIERATKKFKWKSMDYL
ncbi:RNase P/RNase MRP complex subunit [Lithohypha guttulata]|uniref:RNase P/RNase MRP complex subunit n=1 Tax=Lithohypha guttulata TaxID=1690604 RepID=A0ABR0KGM8_9EURO|nr:RNase P/RNase MRP complex subunit [Lithohypha guttulata]